MIKKPKWNIEPQAEEDIDLVKNKTFIKYCIQISAIFLFICSVKETCT